MLCWAGRFLQQRPRAGDREKGGLEYFVILQILDTERLSSFCFCLELRRIAYCLCFKPCPLLRMTLKAALCSLLSNTMEPFTFQLWNQLSSSLGLSVCAGWIPKQLRGNYSLLAGCLTHSKFVKLNYLNKAGRRITFKTPQSICSYEMLKLQAPSKEQEPTSQPIIRKEDKMLRGGRGHSTESHTSHVNCTLVSQKQS